MPAVTLMQEVSEAFVHQRAAGIVAISRYEPVI